MNAAVLCILGLAVFALGYRFYSRYLATKIFALRDDEPVPAVELEDGIDYVPTNKHVLFGHHYASIAGAAPIIGPAVAVVWGWVPALLWVVLGTVFMGAVHDFSTLVMSMRHEGKSVGTIVGKVIGPRSRTLFLLVILCLVMLIIAVFAQAIAKLFMKQPGTVIPINFEIIVALLIGWWCYKRQKKLLVPSLLALVSLYSMVWVGVKVPVSVHAIFGQHTQLAWAVALLVYSFIASVLPVWVLLQPRDFINSHQLFVGLGALIVGMMVAHPTMNAPAFNAAPAGTPNWFPFLFVTIACGAISGFHGLVSSGTTSKQLACATDARPVGYGAMLGEGTLAMISTLAVGAGLANWSGHYDSWSKAASGGVANFVQGAASFLVALGIPRDPSQVVVAVLVISFAATSLDTGVRIQRYILEELGALYHIGILQNRYVASFIAVLLPFLLIAGGKAGDLWVLFGSTNQLLAGLSLTLVTVWLIRMGRTWYHVGIPMVLVLVVAGIAMATKLGQFIEAGDYLLAVIGSVVLALEVWVVLEGIVAIKRHRAGRADPAVRVV